MAYQFTFTKRFTKHFKDLTAQERKQLKYKLLLAENPIPPPSVPSASKERKICLNAASTWILSVSNTTYFFFPYCYITYEMIQYKWKLFTSICIANRTLAESRRKMIHLFNRHLLYVGYSQNCKNDILKILDDNHIPCRVKVWNVRHADARGRGTFGQLKQYQTTYEIYVAKSNFKMSEKLIRHVLEFYSSK